jgi:hydrogenase expression/formation protein HypC
MCLAVPMRVVSIDRPHAVVEQSGARRTINVGLIDEVGVGDYVLVHAGYAITRVDEEEARCTLELIEQLAGGLGPAEAGGDAAPDARGGDLTPDARGEGGGEA